MSDETHWDGVYSAPGDAEVSWTRQEPATSVSLIAEVPPTGSVIDVAGGTSSLAGRRLLEAGRAVAVLDISQEALDRARARLVDRAALVRWIAGGVTDIEGIGAFDVWHDRAVFHFLTGRGDRQRYAGLLMRTLPPGGHPSSLRSHRTDRRGAAAWT